MRRAVTPRAIVFCKDNEVKWSETSESLPYQYLYRSNFPDGYSGAGEYFEDGIDHQKPLEALGDAWFGDHQISEV